MADTGSIDNGVEKLDHSIKGDLIEIEFLKLLKRLDLFGAETYVNSNGRVRTSEAHFRLTMLEVTTSVDLSGEEWDDDCNPKAGRDS